MTTPEVTADYEKEPALLSRPLSLSQVRWEVLAYLALIAINLLTHIWQLGQMAMHHDEAVHAWMSWKFFTGQGGFECGLSGRSFFSYCYNPVYHGPTLYLGTYASFFLFGISEATARLPMALAGVGLVASCWMLRPLLGQRAALLTAAYLTISPSILYFTRFARHDALILLWSLWLLVGIFRYMQERRAQWLYLAAAALALAWATHELTFILLFILGTFFLIRGAVETLHRQVFIIIAGSFLLGLLLLMIRVVGLIPPEVGGMALLLFVATAMGLLLSLRWPGDPLLSETLGEIAQRRRTALIALGVFSGVFIVCFTVFFTYPLGIFDGLTAGLRYWLGQHGFRRGAQPWFYYVMQLPVYEPAVLLLTLGGIGWWLRAGLKSHPARASEEHAEEQPQEQLPLQAEAEQGAHSDGRPQQAGSSALFAEETVARLFSSFTFYWFIVAVAAFSWAGEKMPWLLVHMTLPATLAGALVLDRMLARVSWSEVREKQGWLIAPAALLFLLAIVSVSNIGMGQAGQGVGRRMVGFVLGVAAVYLIYRKSLALGIATTFKLVAFVLLALLGLYTVRSNVLAVYRHPDVPRELLVYTQTGPDVPLLARQVETIAKNQTRNQRSADDPTGGHTLKVLMSIGGENGEGSLAWPFEWYLRDFQNLARVNNQQLTDATEETFQDASVALLNKAAVTQQTRQALEQAGYVEVADTIFNWWFPETGTGYKDRLYDPAYGCQQVPEEDKSRGIYSCPLNGAWSVLSWPLKPSNWGTIARYLLYRELPANARINGREMLVFMHCDVAPLPTSGCKQSVTQGPSRLKLVAERQLAAGELSEPRAIAVGPQGTIYVADGTANRVVVVSPAGEISSVESAGSDVLNEPSGVAVDQQGNLYVSNTWLARIDKYSPSGEHLASWGEGETDFGGGRVATSTGGTLEGNAAAPLGFFGPRGAAVDSEGNVYIADTGNKRIVVTDSQGSFRYQWGSAGGAPGQFNEPTSVSVGSDGRVYVADSWNGRVQVFERGSDGTINPDPAQVIQIPGWAANTYHDPAVAAGPGGLLAVTVPERHEVRLFNREGQLLLTWGGQGNDDASLNFPSGIAFGPQGLIYVAEKENQRISVFRPPKVR